MGENGKLNIYEIFLFTKKKEKKEENKKSQ